MTAMDELHQAKGELRAALLRGVKGILADERADELIDRYQTALKAAHREKVLRETEAKIWALRVHRAEPLDNPSRVVWERQNAELHGLELAAMEIDPDTPQAACPACGRTMPEYGLAEHRVTHAPRRTP